MWVAKIYISLGIFFFSKSNLSNRFCNLACVVSNIHWKPRSLSTLLPVISLTRVLESLKLMRFDIHGFVSAPRFTCGSRKQTVGAVECIAYLVAALLFFLHHSLSSSVRREIIFVISFVLQVLLFDCVFFIRLLHKYRLRGEVSLWVCSISHWSYIA